MTLVLPTFSNAAPKINMDVNPRPHNIASEEKSTKIDPIPAPEIKIIESEENYGDKKTFFPYDSSFTIRSGAAINFKELRKEPHNSETPVVVGFKYMQESKNSTHHEYGMDLITADDPLFFLNWGYKFIIDHTDNLRPYYKLGLGMRFDEGDHLETPFDFKSYSLLASVGLEDLLSDPHSVRLDLDLHAGTEDFLILLCVGWAYAFN